MSGMHESKGMCKQWMQGAWLPFLIFSVVLWGLLVYTQKELTQAMNLENLGSSQAYTSAYLDRVEEAVKSTVSNETKTPKSIENPTQAYAAVTDGSLLSRLGGFEIFLLMLDVLVATFWLSFIRDLKDCSVFACGKMKESCSKESGVCH
jgi:hypothetical protein